MIFYKCETLTVNILLIHLSCLAPGTMQGKLILKMLYCISKLFCQPRETKISDLTVFYTMYVENLGRILWYTCWINSFLDSFKIWTKEDFTVSLSKININP